MPTLLRLAALAAPVLAALPAAAALPPNYQRLAELKAVLAHPQVGQAFGLEPIGRIEYVRRDVYRLSAGRCHLDIAIVDLPTPRDMAGPRRFEARPGPKVCAGPGKAR
jgi:hypothetical protein